MLRKYLVSKSCLTTRRRLLNTQSGPFQSLNITFDDADLSNLSKTAELLSKSIPTWRADKNISAVWIHLSGSKQSSLIPTALDCGFDYHHALQNNVSLCLWLHESMPNKIPPYATHQIGCGAVVTRTRRQQKQVLLVREARSFEQWKLPGGLADLSEELPDAAEREVLEETGVQATFQSIMALRNSHQMSFGKSDLYVVCHLEVEEKEEEESSSSSSNEVLGIDPDEIEEARWFDVHEWAKTTTHPINLEVIEQLTTSQPTARLQEKIRRLAPDKPIWRMYVPRVV